MPNLLHTVLSRASITNIMSNAKLMNGYSRPEHRRLRVLVDMDGVLCDFEGQFLEDYRQQYPDAPFVPLEERNEFYIDDQYCLIDPELAQKTRAVYNKEGFFAKLKPMPGAIEAVKEMSGMRNVEVYLLTSALTVWAQAEHHYSTKEKFEWVHKHMGRDWLRRLIISSDKTIIRGDLLIDDKPRITGAERQPSWDHVLFTCCHNKHLDISKLRCVNRLDSWTGSDWRELINDYVAKKLSC